MTTTKISVTETQPLPRSLTDEEAVRFRDQGFVIVRDVVAESVRQTMLDVTQDHHARVISPVELEADLSYPGAPQSRESLGGGTIRRLKQAHARHAVFSEFVCEPQFRLILGQIMSKAPLEAQMPATNFEDREPLVMPLAHHNCVMTKMPSFSSETGWHRDIRYWSFQRRELVSAWIALGEENTQNGCLYVIPGSHRMEIARERFDEAEFLRTDLPENQQLIENAVPAELSPGDVLFFHCSTLHSAGQNNSKLPKFSAVFTFRYLSNSPIPGSRSSSLPELLLPLM